MKNEWDDKLEGFLQYVTEIFTSIIDINYTHLLCIYFSKYSIWIKSFNSYCIINWTCDWDTHFGLFSC